MNVCIRNIRIGSVADAGSFNVGTTLNIVTKKDSDEEENGSPQQEEPVEAEKPEQPQHPEHAIRRTS